MLKGLVFICFKKMSNSPKNFRQSFKLQYKPTFRGVVRRFERHNQKTAKMLKFCIAFFGISFILFIGLPPIGLPMQNHVKKWQYRKINDVSYYWLMTGIKPNKEDYLQKKCQFVLMSINSHTEDWQWMLQTLQDTLSQSEETPLNQKQVSLKKDQLSPECRVQIMAYSAILLGKIIQFKSSLLKKQKTYSVFNKLLLQHMTNLVSHKKQFKKQQSFQLLKNYIVFQYLIKYSSDKANLLNILQIYEKCVKQKKMRAFTEDSFHQKTFLNALKGLYIKDSTQKLQKQVNTKVIAIFQYLDRVKKQMQAQQTKNISSKVTQLKR